MTPQDRKSNTPTVGAGAAQDRLGAWVLKCNPQVWNLVGFIDDGERFIHSWTVVQNRRSGMIRRGQRVLLWVTGGAGSLLSRGFWASGWTTGAVEEVSYSATENRASSQAMDRYWLDQIAQRRMRFIASLSMSVWDTPVTEAQVVAAIGHRNLEVIRARQVSNPSWISDEDLARLEAVLPPWPEIAG